MLAGAVPSGGFFSAKKASNKKKIRIYSKIDVFVCFSKKNLVVYHDQCHDQGHDQGHDHDLDHDLDHDKQQSFSYKNTHFYGKPKFLGKHAKLTRPSKVTYGIFSKTRKTLSHTLLRCAHYQTKYTF